MSTERTIEYLGELKQARRDQLRITEIDPSGAMSIRCVFRDGSAMIGQKTGTDMNLSKVHFAPNSPGARDVFQTVDDELQSRHKTVMRFLYTEPYLK